MQLIFQEWGQPNTLFTDLGNPAEYSKGDYLVVGEEIYIVATKEHIYKGNKKVAVVIHLELYKCE